MSSIVLFDDKKDCCGCGACMNIMQCIAHLLFRLHCMFGKMKKMRGIAVFSV